VWVLDLDPVRGHERAGRRPGLVVSADALNHGPSELVIVLPITSVDKRIRFHVAVEPPEGGLRARSFVKPEDIRSISTERARRRLGAASAETMRAVGTRLRVLLEL
jgi:mRNA interferase MazF